MKTISLIAAIRELTAPTGKRRWEIDVKDSWKGHRPFILQRSDISGTDYGLEVFDRMTELWRLL